PDGLDEPLHRRDRAGQDEQPRQDQQHPRTGQDQQREAGQQDDAADDHQRAACGVPPIDHGSPPPSAGPATRTRPRYWRVRPRRRNGFGRRGVRTRRATRAAPPRGGGRGRARRGTGRRSPARRVGGWFARPRRPCGPPGTGGFSASSRPSQSLTAVSAPAPVRERTSISAYFSALYSLLSTVPTNPHRNPIGMERIPGLFSGNQLQSCPVNRALSEPDTTGEKKTRNIAAPRPP